MKMEGRQRPRYTNSTALPFIFSSVHATRSVRTRPETQHTGRSSALRDTASLPDASNARPPALPNGSGPAPREGPAPAGGQPGGGKADSGARQAGGGTRPDHGGAAPPSGGSPGRLITASPPGRERPFTVAHRPSRLLTTRPQRQAPGGSSFPLPRGARPLRPPAACSPRSPPPPRSPLCSPRKTSLNFLSGFPNSPPLPGADMAARGGRAGAVTEEKKTPPSAHRHRHRPARRAARHFRRRHRRVTPHHPRGGRLPRRRAGLQGPGPERPPLWPVEGGPAGSGRPRLP